jgi:hypothetical protein
MAVPDKKTPDTAVRVEKGDTLSQIAKDNGLTLKEIRALNPEIMRNPKYDKGNMIWSNTKINIAPAAPKASTETPATPPTGGPTGEPPTEPPTQPPTQPPAGDGSGVPGSTGAGVSPGQVGGGGATGAMPGGATGFSGGFTQADIDKAFAAGTASATKTEADNKFAVKVAAKDKLINLFKTQGIDDPAFADFVSNSIMNDVSEAQTLIELYDQPAYKLRFPGMAKLRTKNRTITEAQYIGLENQIVETLRFFDLPAGFYDDRATMGKMIENEVSPKEVQDRAQMAQDLARSADPNTRNALMDFYKVGEGAITAYFLNPDKALPLLQKAAKAASIAGIGKTYGFADFGMAEAEQLGVQEAYAKLSESDMTKAFGQASTLAQTQSRLAYLDKETYSDREALDAILEGDQRAIMASTKRAKREQARFGGSSGLSAGSLRTSSNI